VIEAETRRDRALQQVIEFAEGVDPVTADMLTAILRDEEGHMRLFEGFLKEFEAAGEA
jgi:bacterioferritin